MVWMNVMNFDFAISPSPQVQFAYCVSVTNLGFDLRAAFKV